jgi:hypothetical protein
MWVDTRTVASGRIRGRSRQQEPPIDPAASMGMVMGVVREEMPSHVVLYKAAAFEVRKYAPSVLAMCSYGDGVKWGDPSNDSSPFMQALLPLHCSRMTLTPMRASRAAI